MPDTCSNEEIQTLIHDMGTGNATGLNTADRLLQTYPGDARLHFMKGSMLIGEKRLIEAHASLKQAVQLAPDFAIARYQLGFFELTSGEVSNAKTTWQPLLDLPDGRYLKLFVQGLNLLVEDQFGPAIDLLNMGMTANDENAPMNADIQLLIDEVSKVASAPADSSQSSTEAEVSATSLLLQSKRGGANGLH